MNTPKICSYSFIECLEYVRAWDMQKVLANQVAAQAHDDVLLLLEHPPVFTLGRRSKTEDMVTPRGAIESLGASVVDVDRGGEITFHGPGQLIGYPILNLKRWGGPLAYVRALESTLMEVLASYGIEGKRIDGVTGVWVGGAKIGAIGVRISSGVTTHGFALNVTTNLEHFRFIVPCGLEGLGVTSLEHLLESVPPWEQLEASVSQECARVFGRRLLTDPLDYGSGHVFQRRSIQR
mgnify:CR=1 FL=1